MLDRPAITAAYLDEVARRGSNPAQVAEDMAAAESVLLNSFFPGMRYLSRPVFIGYAEREKLHADVEVLRRALVSLPDRLYGGDFAAFARAAGAEGYQLAAILRSISGQVSSQGRADLYEEGAGFRVMEFNMGSALGGMENAELCRWMLREPVLAEFAQTHKLGYTDTQLEQVSNMFAGTGRAPGSFPVVAVTDWPTSYAKRLGPYMGKLAVRWRELGLDAIACHIGELEARRGGIWLGDRRIDIVARMFLLEYLLEPDAAALMDPVLDAVARGETAMFTPLDTELFGSKAALAMISDERNRHLFTAAELATFDRILPWTRAVRPGPVTLEDGTVVDLLDYAIAHQDDLVLKPTLRYGGEGVLPGWQRGTSPGEWARQLAAAAGGPYVLQRRIRPEVELFPAAAGEPVPHIVAWGVYTGECGYGGIITRGAATGADLAVLNVGAGARCGCCLSAQGD
jgi:hypothetical protein